MNFDTFIDYFYNPFIWVFCGIVSLVICIYQTLRSDCKNITILDLIVMLSMLLGGTASLFVLILKKVLSFLEYGDNIIIYRKKK